MVSNHQISGFGILLLVTLGNGLIFWNTRAKIPEYAENPPFRLDDFTKSYRFSSESKLIHLLDGDPSTRWTKLSTGADEKDFDMELRLTHRWDGDRYTPIPREKLEIQTCSAGSAEFSLVLREAINVDKELRLPDDRVVYSETYSFQANQTLDLPLDAKFSLSPTDTYPEGISILVLRAKFPEKSSRDSEESTCLQSVSLR